VILSQDKLFVIVKEQCLPFRTSGSSTEPYRPRNVMSVSSRTPHAPEVVIVGPSWALDSLYYDIAGALAVASLTSRHVALRTHVDNLHRRRAGTASGNV
jgi:hypothetical protein